MSPLTELRPPAQRRSTRVSGLVALAVLTVAVMVLVNNVVFRDPSFVDIVRIDNQTDYSLQIGLRAPDSGARLPLGAARQHCVTEFHTVVDEGSTWVVVLRTQGRDAGELTVPRDQLARDNWIVHVPTPLNDTLHAAGVALPPARPCPGTAPIP
jgi:hypothetical protein